MNDITLPDTTLAGLPTLAPCDLLLFITLSGRVNGSFPLHFVSVSADHNELKLGVYYVSPNIALNSLRGEWCLVHFCIISAL